MENQRTVSILGVIAQFSSVGLTSMGEQEYTYRQLLDIPEGLRYGPIFVEDTPVLDEKVQEGDQAVLRIDFLQTRFLVPFRFDKVDEAIQRLFWDALISWGVVFQGDAETKIPYSVKLTFVGLWRKDGKGEGAYNKVYCSGLPSDALPLPTWR